MLPQKFYDIHVEASTAGAEAAANCIPTPMVVTDRGGYREVVADGVCGFAWVTFPGNTAFGRAMKKAGIADTAYPKGLMVWISDYGQSMARKEAHARAYAEVLRKHGIKAYAASRMD